MCMGSSKKARKQGRKKADKQFREGQKQMDADRAAMQADFDRTKAELDIQTAESIAEIERAGRSAAPIPVSNMYGKSQSTQGVKRKRRPKKDQTNLTSLRIPRSESFNTGNTNSYSTSGGLNLG